jgi:signal peptidase I
VTDVDGIKPDVSVLDLVVFETPQVPLRNLVVFDSPDVRLDQLTNFSTGEPPHKGQFREWTESLVGTVVFVLAFTTLIAQATQVPTESMKPTILVGDHFFLDKIAFPGNYPAPLRPLLPHRSIRRGDIIAFKPPASASTDNIPFVKRVIAIGGDTIEMRTRNVFVNGRKLDEEYKIYADYSADTSRDNFEPQIVPPDSFFVMGDNRDNSNDSRYWGFVDRNSIIGKPLFVYWSYESDPWTGTATTYREWLQGYTSIALHFFSKTRWFRFGTMIR